MKLIFNTFLLLIFWISNANSESIFYVNQKELSSGIKLDTNWDFYWNEFLSPNDSSKNKMHPLVVHVPNSWTNYKNSSGKKFNAHGYATYQLRLVLDKEYDNLGLLIPMIWSANKLWINDKLVHKNGEVGDESKFKNQVVSSIISIPKSKEFILTIQVANYSLFIAGLPKSFKLGYYKSLIHQHQMASISSLMWIACVLLMALYHFVIYAFRKKNKSTLFFAIISILIFIKLLVYGDHYVYEYLKLNGYLSFKWQSTFYYITTFMLVPVGLFYVESLYYEEVKRKIANILFYITAIYSLFILVTPEQVYTPTLLYFNAVNFVGIAYIFFSILLATIRRRPESVLQFSGIIVMILAGLNDALYSKGIELTPFQELIPYSFAIFLCIQFFVIARRFAIALNNEEILTEDLEKKVEERTVQLNSKNEILSKLYKDVTDSIHYAKRIQKTILKEEESFEFFLPEYFIFYQPKDIVSGDFYWIKMQGNYILVAAIDCTGHGVPGAFVSLVANNLMNKAVSQLEITRPDKILNQLAKDYYQSAENTADGMDAAILRFDINREKIDFSGAKNPLYFIRNGILEKIKGDNTPIELFKSQSSAFKYHSFDIKKDDVYYIFSDGFADQFGGEKGKKYLYGRFQDFLLRIHKKPMNEQKSILQSEFENWKGDNAQVDDVLIIGLKF